MPTESDKSPCERLPARHPKSTVLIVDDQQRNLQVVATELSAEGFEIVLADSGPSALARVDARLPDLILLDVMMPGMDGFEVCRLLKEQPRSADIPIIFLSAADEKDIIVRAIEAGGVDYVTKPFNKAELLSRVRSHLALKSARDQLEVLLEQRDEFIGILAHDLKNPLSGVRFSAQLLQEIQSELPEKAARLSSSILEGSERMFQFIEHFLSEAAAARTEIPVTMMPVDLADCVNEAVCRHQAAAERKRITIHWKKPGAITANADPVVLGQVLDNLLSNALKFSHPGSNVYVTVVADESDQNCAVVQVKDEGPGFTDEDKSKVFQRFVRLSARPTGGETSAGLGLSIAKRFVELMGGKIDVESTAGSGATFVVAFQMQ
ncbi:MAG: hybrid sensor histidine kinase/response regulator [Verrucomicrobiales bacterium]